MNELFLNLASQPPLRLALLIVGGYAVIVGGLWLFLRRAMAGGFDPLNVKLISMMGPAILGLLASPLLFGHFTRSYWMIVLFLGIWLAMIRVWGRPFRINLEDRMDVDLQTILLALSMCVSIANITINMVIPGKIPLLMENGSGARFQATEGSRLLTWLTFGVAPVGGMLYAVTGSPRVRRFAKYAVALQFFQGILFASKSGILTIVFILLNAVFVAQQRGEEGRYKQLRSSLRTAVIGAVLLIPFYLALIGVGTGSSATLAVAMRMLGGFDQLILTSQFDLLRHGGELFRENLLQYQWMPIFKVLSDHKYGYSSIGQYVIEGATGTYIEGPFTLPNSNLIMETLLTSGVYLGTVLYCLELGVFYWLRRVTLGCAITPITFVLVVATVFDPLGVFVSGQEWWIETMLLALTVAIAYVLAQLWKGLREISVAHA